MSKETAEEKRARIEERIEKRLKREDADYLNSKSRVVKQVTYSIIEYIIVFILICLVLDYATHGSINLENLPETIKEYLKPGGVILTALIAYLPVLIIGNVGVYFGLGTVGRMAFGIIKILAVLLFLHIFVMSAGDIDFVELSGMSGGMSGVGLESFTVNLEPLIKLLDIILLLCLIIPVAEFLGARRRHTEAVLRQQDREDDEADEKDAKKAEKKAEKEAKKAEKKAAKEAEKNAKEAEKAKNATVAAAAEAEKEAPAETEAEDESEDESAEAADNAEINAPAEADKEEKDKES